MMKAAAITLLMSVAASCIGAEMYRWVDEKGTVNYTPYPPPANIRKVESKKLGDNAASGGAAAATDAPYSVQLAAKNFPVTLWSAPSCGEPCKTARAHLDKRGIPYAEKDASNPGSPQAFEEFKKMTGGNPQVPFLIVGKLKNLQGYLASEWDATLDAAGYPASGPNGKPAAKPTAQAPAPAK